LRPRQSGAHGTCHACHTLDTPLVDIEEYSQSDWAATVRNVWICRTSAAVICVTVRFSQPLT